MTNWLSAYDIQLASLAIGAGGATTLRLTHLSLACCSQSCVGGMGAVPIAATIGQSATGLAPYWKLSDLNNVFARLGERGYRVAQMAGVVAGVRLDLAAVAEGLGATGLTFFDDGVTRFVEPAPEGRQVMYLAAVGRRPA